MSGIFVIAELEGGLAARIHAVQRRHDPRLARELPPHVTLIGSSGAGPISPDVPSDRLRATIADVAAATAPFPLRFRPPLRFIGREIVVLPIDPHGPIRALHERLKASGLPHEVARWPFTPHCTLSYYPTLTEESLRSLLTVRADEEWTLHALRVYHTRELQPPRLLFDVPLGGAGARAAG